MRPQRMNPLKNDCVIWAVVPAAGIGKRMQSDRPKQYLRLIDRPVIEHTINKLLELQQVKGAVVALQAEDPYWSQVRIRSSKPVLVAPGGEERCYSVINALELLSRQAAYQRETAWALVHDAVRPCVSPDDIQHLIDCVAGTESGGLLAMPVRDTMKRADDDQRAVKTLERDELWHALTPQLFSCHRLATALAAALEDGFMVTDESSAMEHAGYRPRLVQGREDNIKITRPADLRLAESYLGIMLEEQQNGARHDPA